MTRRQRRELDARKRAALERFHANQNDAMGPTRPEAVTALYDAITGMIQMLQNMRCDCDEDDREEIARLEVDLALWLARRAELDNWDLLDVRAVLGRKDCWL